MNYLAHLYFSAPTPLAWAGSLMGDFVKGRIPAELPEELRSHLQLHRQIDSYTSVSPAFQASRQRLDPRLRHGRAVLVDVFYDHLLACHWDAYSERPLEEFARQVYAGLQNCFDLLPPALQRQLPSMVEHDWLTSYRQVTVVERVLQRLEARLAHKLPLADGFAELGRNRTALESDFAQFMEEMQRVFADCA